MTGTVHALIGAAAGALVKNKPAAFVAGVVSHVIADKIPHRDIHPAVDVPLLAVMLGLIIKKYGVDSAEFYGAVGGASPDLEHGLAKIGLMDKVFYTHIEDGKYHGRQTANTATQFIAATAALLILFSNRK